MRDEAIYGFRTKGWDVPDLLRSLLTCNYFEKLQDEVHKGSKPMVGLLLVTLEV